LIIHIINSWSDSPGHPVFEDESSVGVTLTDGVVLCVDALEGVMVGTERVIQYSLEMGKPIVLLLTKVDRLIIELKLPPNDAYLKLQHTIEVRNILFIIGVGIG